MSDSAIFVRGRVIRVSEKSKTNRQGKSYMSRLIIMVVDYSLNHRDEVFIRVPESMEMPNLESGKTYELPVSLSVWEGKLSFEARPDVQPRT